MKTSRSGISRHFKKDALAGIIVFLIALPLCLGIAQASGAPLFSGIVSGVIGGIIIGACSKSHLSVSGPAAGLIAITLTALTTLTPPGADAATGFQYFLCAVIIAGALQLVFGVIKAGSIANYFPSNVIEGMLAGIGITIILKEIPKAVGYVKPIADPSGMEDADNGFQWADITDALHHVSPGAIMISIIGLIILALWVTKPFKKLQLIPAGLLVVALGTVLNEIFKVSRPGLYLDAAHLVSLPVPKDAHGFLSQFRLPLFNGFLQPQVWKTGVIIAVVASIETLLCIEATDKLDPMKRYTPGNAELRAQGIGNIISGLVGGLPITSVIVRSSANVNAGAKTKMSTIIHGSLLLVCAAFIPTLLNHVPKAALSAILIFTGYRLCRPSVFKHMWRGGITQFTPFVATAVCVYALNLLEGVGIGLLISIIFMLRQNMQIPFFYQRSVYSNGELIKLTLAQEVSFLNKASIKETLNRLPKNSAVILDASETEYIDFDVLDLIREFAASRAADKNIRLSLIGFKDHYRVPRANNEREVLRPFMEKTELPQRSSGSHKELLEQLVE